MTTLTHPKRRAPSSRWACGLQEMAHGGVSTDGPGKRSAPTIELRLAHPNEAEDVRRLAELDSSPPLTGQVVIALINGDAVAGLSLLDQHVVANPFVPTREAVALLRLRAEHLSGVGGTRKLRRVLRLRPA
jgi:hypothetical protein